MNENIISFVAKGTNSGKTYIVEKLIGELKKRGWKVAAVKHSRHLTSVDNEGKDTFKFAQRGADRVILFSDNALMLYEMAEPNVEYLASLATKGVDIVVVEGFKKGPFKKIEVFNKTLYGKPLCADDPEGNFVAIITDDPVETQIPRFSFHDIKGICSFLEKTAGL